MLRLQMNRTVYADRKGPGSPRTGSRAFCAFKAFLKWCRA
uniref:Uncharacterized protein n=1 Tax=Anguilla anguilla TaxID=7936 RepID=A0A0E9RIF8_ANGAN